jgi:hypothetical protein
VDDEEDLSTEYELDEYAGELPPDYRDPLHPAMRSPEYRQAPAPRQPPAPPVPPPAPPAPSSAKPTDATSE